MNTETKKNGKIAKINFILILLVIAIGIIPLILHKNAEFAGADGRAEEAVTEINSDYKPWFNSIWVPPSGEIETLLFALQAGIGCLVIGYYIGYVRGRKKQEDVLNNDKH